MPRMDNADSSGSNALVKLLLIGDGKVGKTHYAGMAAAAGFNVFYADGDVGSATLARLPIEARKRIYTIDCRDTFIGGAKDYKFLETMQALSVGKPFKWNDTKSQISSRKIDEVGDEIWTVWPTRMGNDVVFVTDSWTGLTESIMTAAAEQAGVDLSNATTGEMRNVYNPAGVKANMMLQLIRSMPCHVIVIAHPDEFIKQKNPEGVKVSSVQEKDKIIEWTKMIPKSTSKPHGFSMSKYFTDIAWAEISGSGKDRLLNFRVSKERVSGGHFDDLKKMDGEYAFSELVRGMGGKIPDGSQSVDHWITIHKLTADDLAPKTLTPVKPLDGTVKADVKASGMTNMFSKKS